MVRSVELDTRTSPARTPALSSVAQRTQRPRSALAWVVPLCLGLAACAQTYPRVIAVAPEASAPASYAQPTVPVYTTEPAQPVVPVYAPDPAPPRMVIAAPEEAGPRPNPNPDPVPAAAPKAPLAPYTPQASPLLAYDSTPHGAPPREPEVLPEQTQTRVSTSSGPYYRSQVWVGAPYYHVRPYYGYRVYPPYVGGPRFGLGWYGGHWPHTHNYSAPRAHYGHSYSAPSHHGYGHRGGHGGHAHHGHR